MRLCLQEEVVQKDYQCSSLPSQQSQDWSQHLSKQPGSGDQAKGKYHKLILHVSDHKVQEVLVPSTDRNM